MKRVEDMLMVLFNRNNLLMCFMYYFTSLYKQAWKVLKCGAGEGWRSGGPIV